MLSQKHAKKALDVSMPVWSTLLTRHSPSRPACTYASQINSADALSSKPLHDVYAHGAFGGCSGGGGCEDCCYSWFCSCCTQAQIMRHVGMKADNYNLCAPGGMV